MDLRLLNRRVLESLVKAGAFDGVGVTRAGLLAGLDQAMEAGQRRQRDRDEGQTSLFEAAGGAAAPAKETAAPSGVPEWPTEQLLGYEKEVLGFYLSGHPLERYRDHARDLGTASAADVAVRPVGARVALLGQVSQLRERATKSGNRMAFASLDAVDGAVALTIFPEALKSCSVALRAPGPVLVKGRIDETDKGRVVLVEDVKPLEEALLANGGRRTNGRGEEGNGRHAHACRIRVRAAEQRRGARGAGGGANGLRRAPREHPALPACAPRGAGSGAQGLAGGGGSRARSDRESGALARAGQYHRGVCRTSLSSRSRSSSWKIASPRSVPPRTKRPRARKSGSSRSGSAACSSGSTAV